SCLFVVACTSPSSNGTPSPSPGRSGNASVAGVRSSVALDPSLKMMEVGGAVHEIGDSLKGTALVFVNPGCPISNAYVPDLNELWKHAVLQGVGFYGVVSDPCVTRTEAATFQRDFKVQFPLVFDSSGELASSLRPSRTPESFVVG